MDHIIGPVYTFHHKMTERMALRKVPIGRIKLNKMLRMSYFFKFILLNDFLRN
jgi:hypothetical protein